MKRSVAGLSVAAPLAAAIAGIAPAASAAPAQIFQIHDVSPLPEVASLPECLDARVGSQTGSETLNGKAVVTGNTFNFRGTGTLDYTVTFDDGTVVTGTSVEHISFHATGGGKTVQTTAIQERRDIVDASGNLVGTVTIHALSHTTYVDTNDNGQPDLGEFSSLVDRFFFTCH